MEPGPCLGNHTRWFYHEETGICTTFAYGGCHGNRNRFMTQGECEAACRHKRHTLETTQRCRQPTVGQVTLTAAATDEAALMAIVTEQCAATAANSSVPVAASGTGVHARWAFDEKTRRCRPFYFPGCGGGGGGNSNNFERVEECEASCPSAFPPELEVVAKVLNVEEGKETVLEIRVEGNPFPNVTWQHNSNGVEFNERLEMRADR